MKAKSKPPITNTVMRALGKKTNSPAKGLIGDGFRAAGAASDKVGKVVDKVSNIKVKDAYNAAKKGVKSVVKGATEGATKVYGAVKNTVANATVGDAVGAAVIPGYGAHNLGKVVRAGLAAKPVTKPVTKPAAKSSKVGPVTKPVKTKQLERKFTNQLRTL